MELYQAAGHAVSALGNSTISKRHSHALTDDEWTLYISISVGLVLLAGLMSGLTLGLMSLNVLDMEVCIGMLPWTMLLPCMVAPALHFAPLHTTPAVSSQRYKFHNAMQVLRRSGTAQEKAWAKRIEPVCGYVQLPCMRSPAQYKLRFDNHRCQ